ncbi:MAG: hypothetical protein AABM67_04955 [Acidobacteriota bacterium]
MRERAIEAVIDSVTLNSAFQPPKPSRKSAQFKADAVNPLDKPISDRRLKLALDEANGLRSEWVRTCGLPAVQAFVVHCEQYAGIQLIKTPVSPGSAASKKLRFLGFGNNPVDKLILRIALATQDRIIVSDDSDFWDPKKPNDRRLRGDKNAPVARFCRKELGVTILLLKKLLAKFA